MNEPLFRSTEEALRWAFNRRPVGERSLMGSFVGERTQAEYSTDDPRLGPVPPGGFDGIAQAGMILAAVERLPRDERNVIYMRHARWNDREAVAARFELIDLGLAQMPAGHHTRRMIDTLVQRYYGRNRAVLGEMAKQYGIHRNSMQDKWARVCRALREVEARAMSVVAERLDDGGVVEKGECRGQKVGGNVNLEIKNRLIRSFRM
jgi:hypothetical protein